MTMLEELPAPKEVRDVLVDLLGRDVTVHVGAMPPETPVPVTAEFVHDDLSLAGLIGFQLVLAANVAAAVGLVPAGGAKACVSDGELSPMLGDNLCEICNVLTGLFNRDGGPHVRLRQVYLKGADVPPELRTQLRAVGSRLDLSVAITGYDSGAFSLVLAR